MDVTSIRLLKGLTDGDVRLADLPGLLGRKTRWLACVVRGLTDQGYVEKSGAIIGLRSTPKTTLFRDVMKITDVEKLLAGSNETVFSHLADPRTLAGLARKTGLSKATVYRSVSDLRSIGAITRNGDYVQVNGSHESLVMFANLLAMEREGRYEGGGAEIIYRDGSTILRKVRAGKAARGATTGFTLFADYGIDYRPVHDYFCEQAEPMDIQDVLLHAVYSSVHSGNRMELVMSIVFYAKHRDGMDVAKLRQRSSVLGISGIWLDIESYMSRKGAAVHDLFLPWREFVAKAELYEIPAENYTHPDPSETLFEEIGGRLSRPVTAYLFGGENMRIKSLKNSTRDCDLAVGSKKDFDGLSGALVGMGYKKITKTGYSDEDMRMMPSEIFAHGKKGRIYLFTSTIMRVLTLSPGMKGKSDILDYGRLKIGLLRNEHVFLLKAVACREGDIQDMASLAAGGRPAGSGGPEAAPFDWDLVWDEILGQEEIDDTPGFTAALFDQISYLAERTGIPAQFSARLRRRAVDQMIRLVLLGGSLPAGEMVALLAGADITEQVIRNRIDSLERNATVRKRRAGRATLIELLQNNRFSKPEQRIDGHRLGRYLDWRFHMREKPGERDIRELAAELKGFGFGTIGEIDGMILHATEVLRQYELEHFSKGHFDGAGAARICIGVHHSTLGKNSGSPFFISEFDKYHRMLDGDALYLQTKKRHDRRGIRNSTLPCIPHRQDVQEGNDGTGQNAAVLPDAPNCKTAAPAKFPPVF